MTLKHLKIFICVAKHENITHAAEELYMAQPAVSLAISQLEDNYNVKLFERIKQRIKITEEGRLLLQYANSIINDFEEFEEIAFNKSINRIINIGSSLSVGEKLVPKLFKSINKENIRFTVAPSDVIIEEILNGNIDLAIVETPKLDSRLNVTNLTNDQVIFVASKDLNIPNEITITDLIKYPLLVRNKNTGVRETFDNLLKSHNLIINPKIEAISNLSLLEFAINEFGIAVLPKIICSGIESLKEIKIKEIELNRPISLIYKQSKILKVEELKLIDYIKTHINLI